MSRRGLLGSILGALLAGCGTARGFLVERALDFTDIVDVQVGAAVGLGAKVEATDYLGAGLGWGYAEGREFYGRRVARTGGAFLHGLLWGVNDMAFDWGGPIEEEVLLVQTKSKRAPPLSRARIGASVMPLFGCLGVYVNLGEIVDFLAGWVGLDPAEDAGVPKGAPIELGLSLHGGPESAPSAPPGPGRTSNHN